MSKFQRFVEICAVAGVTAGVTLYAVNNQDNEGKQQTADSCEELHFWYAAEEYQPYLESAVAAYEEKTGVEVKLHYRSKEVYAEKLEEAVIHETEEAPDVFLTENKTLSSLYMEGVAAEANTSFFDQHKEEYPSTAYNSVVSHEKYVAYPLGFDTSIFLYNTNATTVEVLAQEDTKDSDGDNIPEQIETKEKTIIPKTFEDVLEFADSFDGMNGVENVFKWDVSDVFSNYFFTGAYMNIGGKTGEEESLDIVNEKSLMAMQYFKNMKEYFALDMSSLTYEDIVEEFADGKTVFIVARTDAVEEIEKQNAQKAAAISVGDAKEAEDLPSPIDYGILPMPQLTKELDTCPMSETTAVVVNDFSKEKEAAKSFAEFLTYEYADTLYEKTGVFSARICNKDNSPIVDGVYKQYENSISMPKTKLTDTILLRLEAAFANIWLADSKGSVTDDEEQETLVVDEVVKKELENVEQSLTGLFTE